MTTKPESQLEYLARKIAESHEEIRESLRQRIARGERVVYSDFDSIVTVSMNGDPTTVDWKSKEGSK